ncbi:hypothetical protein D1007_15839 [Hordeum vulgare]|nr:hypothetical protein D1007_15839 [Hordeum vulgare]
MRICSKPQSALQPATPLLRPVRPPSRATALDSCLRHSSALSNQRHQSTLAIFNHGRHSHHWPQEIKKSVSNKVIQFEFIPAKINCSTRNTKNREHIGSTTG